MVCWCKNVRGLVFILTPAMYTPPNPSPLDNLLALYKLEPIANSISRVKSDGSKGVKLRKSYKNHILDLPGKHQIPAPKPVDGQILNPELSNLPDVIKEFDSGLLASALKFDKTSINGIPGFNTADLAISDTASGRGEDMSEIDEYKKKRKKKQMYGSEIKRQHI